MTNKHYCPQIGCGGEEGETSTSLESTETVDLSPPLTLVVSVIGVTDAADNVGERDAGATALTA